MLALIAPCSYWLLPLISKNNGVLLNNFEWNKVGPHLLRAALHLEVGPIRCVRGFKSSLVIGQKAQISPNPFTPRGRGDLVVRFLILKNVCYDTARAR
jgi:hypothetical protein